MKKPSILLAGFLLSATVLWSQNITGRDQSVIDSADAGFVKSSTNLPFFNSSADAEKIVADIMDALGMEGNFKIKVANVPNVEATIRHHERYILYNPEFVNKVNAVTGDKWASIFILAHEVGHHLEGHTLTDIKSRHDIELQADQFAGFTLCKMGATLQEAQLAMYFIANSDASKTHPGRADRLVAIKKGWDKAESQMNGLSYNSNITSQTKNSQN
jgi:ribosomal protein S19